MAWLPARGLPGLAIGDLLRCCNAAHPCCTCVKGRDATMAFLTELGEVLHEEHFRILSAICGLENRVVGTEGRRPIDPSIEEEKQQRQELIIALDQIVDHNAFEEAVLFPLICARNGGELTSI